MTETIDLERSLAILRRRAPVILLCLLLVGGSAYFFSKQQAKRYTAKSSLVFSEAQLAQQLSGLSVGAGLETKARQQTEVKLLEVGPVAGQVAAALGEGLTPGSVKESVKIVPEGESSVIGIEATAASPQLAASIANAYASRFAEDQAAAATKYLVSAQALVQRQLAALSKSQRAGPQGLALRDREQSLAILAGLHGGGIEVAERASPPAGPSSPNITRNVALGAVLGLIIGLGIAFLIERLDRRIKEPEDLERAYRLPLLGSVPESAAYRRAALREGAPLPPLPTAELEAMRMLRARLRYFNVDRDVRLVLITSATPGDGKSTITLGLAEAAASMGARVLMIEADLRRPALANLLGLSAGPGLAEAIVGVATLEEAVQEARIGGQEGEDLELHGAFAQARAEGEGAQLHGAEGEGAQLHGAEGEGAQLHRAVGERAGREGVQLEGARREHAHTHLPGARALRSQVGSVSLLSAGYGVPNPTGMIESRAIEEVLSWAGSIYDLVLIDTPPMSVVPDAIPLLRKVDGVIVVGRLRRNSAEEAARLAEELRSLEAPTLGVVANGVNARGSRYGYAYRYSTGGSEPKRARMRGERPLSRSAS